MTKAKDLCGRLRDRDAIHCNSIIVNVIRQVVGEDLWWAISTSKAQQHRLHIQNTKQKTIQAKPVKKVRNIWVYSIINGMDDFMKKMNLVVEKL